MVTSKGKPEQQREDAIHLDVAAIRRDFPVLDQELNGHPLAYLDNAASSQRPSQVLDAMRRYYTHDHANVHRGVHTLSHRATDLYEGARETVRAFVNAESVREIVFTRGTTEAINLVAFGLGQRLQPGDEILITTMEHHSNIVPWQLLCERTGAILRVRPSTMRGNPAGTISWVARPANENRILSARLERAWHHQPGQCNCRCGQGPRHSGVARRSPGHPPRTGRCPRAGCELLHLFRAQDCVDRRASASVWA